MSNAEDSEPLLSLPRNGEPDDDDDVDPSPQPVAQLGCVNETEEKLKQFQVHPPQANDDVFGVITVTKQPHARPLAQPQYLPQFRPGDMQRPTNYTWLACVSAICCCPLLGLVGVYYGMLSEKQYNDGQHVEARESSQKALGFTIAAVIVGIIIVIISVPVNIVLLMQRSRYY